jgi:hypothetical protein
MLSGKSKGTCSHQDSNAEFVNHQKKMADAQALHRMTNLDALTS